MKILVVPPLVLFAALLIAGCESRTAQPAAAPQTARAALVQSREVETAALLHATGTLHAHESAQLSAQIPGRLTAVLVREGDSVRAGQVLARIEDAAQRSAVEQAEAGLKAAAQAESAAQSDAALARATLERYKKLQVEKSVSAQEMDEISSRAAAANARAESARAQRESARAQLDSARTMLSYAQIRAPFDGVVTARSADPGTFAAPGMPVLTVDQAGPLELWTNIDESAVTALHRGMQIPVTANGITRNGTIRDLVPAADPASRTFLVKLAIPATPEWRAGMYATASIPLGRRKAVFVPSSSVVQRGSLPCVYVLDQNGAAQLRYITLGARQDGFTEALSGIAAGETVVDAPADRELAGMKIVPEGEVR